MDECVHPGCGETVDGVDGKCMFHSADDLESVSLINLHVMSEKIRRAAAEDWEDFCLQQVAPFHDEGGWR